MPVRVSALDTYKWMVAQGFKPIEVGYKTKLATTGEWNSASYAPQWEVFQKQTNIGARLGPGELGGDLYDVDVDAPEALYYARHILPPTLARFGRASNPDSHYLYRLPPDSARKTANRQYNDPIKVMLPNGQKAKQAIIDVRGGGNAVQTVMPGSVHESGEHVEWSSDEPPQGVPMVDPEILDEALKRIAFCVLVERHFWLDGQRHEMCKRLSGMLYFLGIEEDDATQMLRLVMRKTGDEDEQNRYATISGTYRKASQPGKKTQGASSIKKEWPHLAPAVDIILTWFGGESTGVVDEYNEQFALIMLAGDLRVARTVLEPTPRVEFIKLPAFEKFFNDDTISIDGKKIPKHRIWMNSPNKQKYTGITFAPGLEGDPPDGSMNLWRGWGVKPADIGWSDARQKCHLWLNHLRDVVCGGDETVYRWCLAWFADIIRNPHVKTGTCLAIIGGQGAGKSSLFQYFGKLLGKSSYIQAAQPRSLTGNFNAHLQACLLLHAEEAVYARDKTAQSILKNLITDEEMQLEKKGQDIVTIRNTSRVAFTSNSQHVIGAEHDDRRYTFIDMKKRRMPAGYGKAMVEQGEDGGYEALFAYLLKCPEIDTELCRQNLQNDDVVLQKVQSNDMFMQWWTETLNRGVLLARDVNWAQSPPHEAWPAQSVSTSALYTSYLLFCKNKGNRFWESSVTFAHLLRRVLDDHPCLDRKNKVRSKYMPPDNWIDVRDEDLKALGVLHNSAKHFPSLDYCRKAYCQFMHIKEFEWDDAPEAYEAQPRSDVPPPAGAPAL